MKTNYIGKEFSIWFFVRPLFCCHVLMKPSNSYEASNKQSDLLIQNINLLVGNLVRNICF